MRIAIASLSTAIVFLLIDMVWLGYVANGFYRSQLGSFMADSVNLPAAAAFYLVFIAGVTIFVLTPALEAESWRRALLYGALFGLTAYATYDLTNLATLRDWPLAVSLVDMAWGAILTGIASAAGVAIAQRFS